MNFLRQGFQKLSSDRQTDRIDWNYKPCHFAGGQICHRLPGNITVQEERKLSEQTCMIV